MPYRLAILCCLDFYEDDGDVGFSAVVFYCFFFFLSFFSFFFDSKKTITFGLVFAKIYLLWEDILFAVVVVVTVVILSSLKCPPLLLDTATVIFLGICVCVNFYCNKLNKFYFCFHFVNCLGMWNHCFQMKL